MKRRMGIDSQTVFGLSPLDHIALAAEMGCGHISFGVGPVPWKISEIREWSLRDDAALRRDVVAAAADSSVKLALGEGFVIRSALDIRNCASDLDIMSEMGVEAISTCGLEGPLEFFTDQFGILCEMAGTRGLNVLLEFAPPHTVPGLQEALEVVRTVSQPHVGLLIDAMHFFRCGNRIEELTSEVAECVGRIQLCDAPLQDVGKTYLEEACFERKAPGEGELPLADLLAALPRSIPVGLEIPNRAASPDLDHLRQWVGKIVDRSDALLSAEWRAVGG